MINIGIIRSVICKKSILDFIRKINKYIKIKIKRYLNYMYNSIYYIYRGKSPITDPLLIPTPSRISVNIRVIKKLYIHELFVI